VAVVVGPVLLAIALGYAGWQWRHRRRGLDPVREAATEANYRSESEASRKAKKATTEDETRP
jgi:hypothetical protein